MEPLLAACDMLTLRALELAGKRLVTRSRRTEWQQMSMPWHRAHTVWAASDDVVDAALRAAWSDVPLAMRHAPAGVTAGEVRRVLDAHARECLALQRPHDVDLLRVRLEVACGAP